MYRSQQEIYDYRILSSRCRELSIVNNTFINAYEALLDRFNDTEEYVVFGPVNNPHKRIRIINEANEYKEDDITMDIEENDIILAAKYEYMEKIQDEILPKYMKKYSIALKTFIALKNDLDNTDFLYQKKFQRCVHVHAAFKAKNKILFNVLVGHKTYKLQVPTFSKMTL